MDSVARHTATTRRSVMGGTLELSAVIAGTVKAGTRIRRVLLDPPTALAEYGVPAVDDKTWGFQLSTDPGDLDELNALRLLSAANGGAATAQIFDDEVSGFVREEATGLDILHVSGARELEVGDLIRTTDEDGAPEVRTISTIDEEAGTLEQSGAFRSIPEDSRARVG